MVMWIGGSGGGKGRGERFMTRGQRVECGWLAREREREREREKERERGTTRLGKQGWKQGWKKAVGMGK